MVTHDIATYVRAFYETMPFNYEVDTGNKISRLRQSNQLQDYVPLAKFLRLNHKVEVLDLGCGTGWFANTLAYWYKAKVWGIDFCLKALQQARTVSQGLRIESKINYICADLFNCVHILKGKQFKVVNSLGVLHHTHDCFQAFKVMVSLCAPRGYIHVGLYHKYARAPLLKMFEDVRICIRKEKDEQKKQGIVNEGFKRWKTFFSDSLDQTYLWSWYRDQCLHPFETQVTLKEVLQWCQACGIRPLSTSLNHFQENPNWSELIETEHKQQEIGFQKIHKAREYFPGFFILWGRKL